MTNDWVIMQSETNVSQPLPSVAYCPSPGWMWAWQPWWWWWWWWCRLGITPDSFIRALWRSYQQRHVDRAGGMGEGMITSRIRYILYVKEYFTCRTNLRHEISGFTSHPKKGVQRIFIALESIVSPGLNPRPLSPVASTLTTHYTTEMTYKTVLLNALDWR
jgi:hypothetical protein